MKLFIYGLSDEELAAVRARVPDAAVERLTALPDRAPEELLIVGAAAFGEFVQWAERRTQEDGIQPRPVLLYVGQVDNLPYKGQVDNLPDMVGIAVLLDREMENIRPKQIGTCKRHGVEIKGRSYVYLTTDSEVLIADKGVGGEEMEYGVYPVDILYEPPIKIASVFELVRRWTGNVESAVKMLTAGRLDLSQRLIAAVLERRGEGWEYYDGVVSDEAWEYYDGVVSDEDWERLDALLECPHVLDAELAAADVRAHFLRDLKRPVTELRVGEILFGDSEWNRSESEMRQHLATCVTCRAAFNEALEWRMNLRGQLLRPVWQEWLTAKMVVQVAGEQAVQERRRQTALAALLTALLGTQLRARTIQLMGERGAVTVDDIPDLLAQLQEGATFVRPHRELKLQLSDGQLMFDSLRGEYAEEVRNFRLELRRGEETLWGANSVEGKVSLPLTELEQALAAGADQLLILTPPEEG